MPKINVPYSVNPLPIVDDASHSAFINPSLESEEPLAKRMRSEVAGPSSAAGSSSNMGKWGESIKEWGETAWNNDENVIADGQIILQLGENAQVASAVTTLSAQYPEHSVLFRFNDQHYQLISGDPQRLTGNVRFLVLGLDGKDGPLVDTMRQQWRKRSARFVLSCILIITIRLSLMCRLNRKQQTMR